MSYVRAKMINGYGPYYYLVKSERVNGQSRQIHISYLGKNPAQKSGTATAATLKASGEGTRNGPTDKVSSEVVKTADRTKIREHLRQQENEHIELIALRSDIGINKMYHGVKPSEAEKQIAEVDALMKLNEGDYGDRTDRTRRLKSLREKVDAERKGEVPKASGGTEPAKFTKSDIEKARAVHQKKMESEGYVVHHGRFVKKEEVDKSVIQRAKDAAKEKDDLKGDAYLTPVKPHRRRTGNRVTIVRGHTRKVEGSTEENND